MKCKRIWKVALMTVINKMVKYETSYNKKTILEGC